MRILIWSQYFWPEHFHINSVARELYRRGHRVCVLTGKPNYPSGSVFAGYRAQGVQREDLEGVEVVRIPLRPRGMGSAIGLALNYLSFVASGYLFAARALRHVQFDLVFVYAPSPLLQALPALTVARSRHVPLVLWVQDLWPEALEATGFVHNRLLLGAIRWLIGRIYRRADSILIQSEGFRESVTRLAGEQARIAFLPNSADPVAGEAASADCATNLTREISQHFGIVFAGNIGTAQSCETIVQAAWLLRDEQSIRFYLVGDGSMAAAIARQIEADGLSNVQMVGRLPAEEMPAIYAASSVLLLVLADSPTLSVTIPSKLQGYMAAGKPIIASSNGESADLVLRAAAGLAAPAEDAPALAAAVRRMHALSPQEREQMGLNGREYFSRHFNPDAQLDWLIAHFDSVIGQRP